MKNISETNLNDVQREALASLLKEADKLLTAFFTREGLSKFSNEAFSPCYLANLDSIGRGPEGAYYVGRKRVYDKRKACLWLASRVRKED